MEQFIPMQPVAYRIREFCRMYAISRATVYREIADNKLTIIKHGRRTLIARVEAERWFACIENMQAIRNRTT